MAKIYREDQRVKRPELFIILGIFSLLLLKEWFYFIWMGDSNPGFAVLSSLTVLFGLSWWFLLKLRMRIRIGKRLITVQYRPLTSRKHIIDLERVESFEFYKIPESSLWSGWGVRFFSDNKYFSLGDHAGLHVTMKDGREYIISSSKLLSERQSIEKRLVKKREISFSELLPRRQSTTKRIVENIEI